jgi:hypothetical protein
MKIFCKLGFHDWHHYHEYQPSRFARIVTKWTYTAICNRCKKIIKEEYNFDPKTGAPIYN